MKLVECGGEGWNFGLERVQFWPTKICPVILDGQCDFGTREMEGRGNNQKVPIVLIQNN